jgi:5-(carboxyamino)imidazole ribonucleotide synthase
MSSKTLLPGTTLAGQPATLGVMGGGQLGRMFVHAAQAMGYHTAVLDPDPASPAGWSATTMCRPITSTGRAWRR